MPILSIIVPVYNSENRLKKCIDSILNQTFSDFELILVDDGSKDSSGKICEDYAKKDSRIKLIHQENMGVSEARNTGLRCAVGKYVGFVDSDDYIDKRMYEVLYSLMIENNADITVCGVRDIDSDKEIKFPKNCELLILRKHESIKFLLIGKYLTMYAVNKLYKKDFFNKLYYPPGKIYEDTIVTPQIFSLANKVVYTSENLYNYVKNPASITNSKFSQKDMDIIEAGRSTLKFAKEKFPDLIKAAEYRYIWSYMCVIDRMIVGGINSKNIDYIRLTNFIKKNKMKILYNPYFSSKRKLGLLLLIMSERLYRRMILKNIE